MKNTINRTEGIYYSYIGSKITKLFKIKYNPNNKNSFDVEPLTDKYKEDFFFKIISETLYYNPDNDITCSFENDENLEYLIETIGSFYSNISSGILFIEQKQESTIAIKNK